MDVSDCAMDVSGPAEAGDGADEDEAPAGWAAGASTPCARSETRRKSLVLPPRVQLRGFQPLIQVYYEDRQMWWSMPEDKSQELHNKYLGNEVHVEYSWSYPSSTANKRQKIGHRSEYELNFRSQEQRNKETSYIRKFCVRWKAEHQEERVLQRPAGYHPIVQVFYEEQSMWWNMPADISEELYNKCVRDKEVNKYPYTWEYDDTRTKKLGTRRDKDGKLTQFSDYIMDFESFQQINNDTKRSRAFRIVFEETCASRRRFAEGRLEK